jgi:hypothetical protein
LSLNTSDRIRPQRGAARLGSTKTDQANANQEITDEDKGMDFNGRTDAERLFLELLCQSKDALTKNLQEGVCTVSGKSRGKRCWLLISPLWDSVESHVLCLPYVASVIGHEERFVPDSMDM